MGGGLGFLNKKTWHPGRLDNVEKVWKKEQEHAKEQNKLEDLRKQIADERQKEELEMIAAAAGHKVRSDRLDWMYQGGMLAKQEADQRTEEAMMSGKPVQEDESTELNKAQQAVLLPTFYSEDTPASANETWARLHSDPLFAIRQQEQTARKAIVANPVKMDHIKAEVEKLKQNSALNKAAKKAEKKANKEAKKDKKRAAHQMGAALAAKGVGSITQAPSRSQPAPDHPSRRNDSEPPSRHDQPYLCNSRAREDDSHQGHREDSNRAHKQRRLHSPERAKRTDHDRHRSSDDRHEGADRGHIRAYARDHDSRQHNGHTTAQEPRRHAANGHKKRDSAQTDSRNGHKYGLSWGETAPEELQARDRQDAAAATRKRLDDAAQLKAQEEQDKAAQRHQRQEYKTGKLSQEEKARRLAEMQGNAEVHDDARWKRLSDEKQKDADEAIALANQGSGSAAAFLKQAHKTIYGATGEGASLEDRVGRRKYYNDRDTERGAFKR
ncbi:hypothetical protein ABBQ38_011342 [Trebouxia sp. C0009 RCD-2024]